MKTIKGKTYITADDVPLGSIAATELDRLHKDLGGTRGYGGEVSGQWLRVPVAVGKRYAAVMGITPPVVGEAAHTPTPYGILESAYSLGEHGETQITAHDRTVAVVYYERNKPSDSKQAAANAAFIVRAANNFDALITLARNVSNEQNSPYRKQALEILRRVEDSRLH